MPIQHALRYLMAYIPALAVVAAIHFGGLWLLLPPALVWLIIPLADYFGGVETRWGDVPGSPPRWLCRLYVLVWPPMQLGLIVWGLSVALDIAVPANAAAVPRDLGSAALLIVDLGILGGATGITFAHELMHRQARLDRAMAELLMTSMSYPWFCIEHVYGHHKRVATAEDPATSRLGESLYAYLPRTIWGGLRSAIALERRRLAKRGRSWWHPTSRLLRHGLLLLSMYGAAYLWRGLPAVLATGLMGLTAVLLLEAINYIEHYGLQRRLADGAVPQSSADDGSRRRYEKVRPHHSWNSGHRVSNYMLINLARHSDHHAHAARSWEQLRHFEDAPQMPTGYGAMLLLAFVPPLWFAVMDPRVAALRRGD